MKIELAYEYQQIILACKGHSYLKMDKYDIVKNVLQNIIGNKINDHIMFWWLKETIYEIENKLYLKLTKTLFDYLFSTSMAFPNITVEDNINVKQMNNKIISFISCQVPVITNKGELELKEDYILNKLYEE